MTGVEIVLSGRGEFDGRVIALPALVRILELPTCPEIDVRGGWAEALTVSQIKHARFEPIYVNGCPSINDEGQYRFQYVGES